MPNDSVGEEEIGRITFVRLSKSTYRKLALQDKSLSLLATNLPLVFRSLGPSACEPLAFWA